MKKDRNTFFQEYGMFNQTQVPTPNMNIANAPFTTASFANQGFYAGPANNGNVPLNYNTQPNQSANYSDYNDFESRLSKLERQLNRLDARVSKLESGTMYSHEDIETTNNVYMV